MYLCIPLANNGPTVVNRISVCDKLHWLISGLTAGLKKYYEVNQSLPMRIFVFRDGVGDGQLPAVVEHEVSQIRNALKEVSPK